MSSFSVAVVRLIIEPHPDPETTALELARVGGYVAVVRKRQFQTGDIAAYIPEQAIVPTALLDEMGLTGRLGGPEKNRVRAVRLRGVLSQGLVYPARPGWAEGQDVAEELGVVKWEPPVPGHLSGRVVGGYAEDFLSYDVENAKHRTSLIPDGEPVVMTEKLHGTLCQVVVRADGTRLVSSKGMGARGFALDPTAPDAEHNVYLRAAVQYEIAERARREFGERPVVVLGEVFGRGVQDLHYGTATSEFRVFDIWLGTRHSGRFLDDAALSDACERMGIPVSGAGRHVREGVVVRPLIEREHPRFGRVQVKSVSGDYLTRRGGTEFN